MNLDTLIPQYAANKAELDGYKKICDRENKQIKELMVSGNYTEYPAGEYIAKYIVQQHESMNEDVLISLFTSVPAFVKIAEDFDIVKTKKYIDFDSLENAIYNDALSDNQLSEISKAKEIKKVITLRVSKKKKEEK